MKMWLQENLLAVGVFGLCTALVQVGGTPPQALSLKNRAVGSLGSRQRCRDFLGDGQGQCPRGGAL